MRILRTPEDRFANLPGYPFSPNYLDVETNLRMHYVDEGPRCGRVMLLLHGEPSWSYLYRKMIPPLAAAGFRVIAPDLIGFGKSDKPAEFNDYSYARHVAWVMSLVKQLDLSEMTLFCQDWGSLIGLRAAGEHPELFARIVVGNGMLPLGEIPASFKYTFAPVAFLLWRLFAQFSPVFPIGRIVSMGCISEFTPEIRAAYDAPFPSSKYKAGARIFPKLVPADANNIAIPDNLRAWKTLGQFHKPFLTLFGRNDPLLGKADTILHQHIPGCAGQPHERIKGGHFIQEDRGEYLAEKIIAWVG